MRMIVVIALALIAFVPTSSAAHSGAPPPVHPAAGSSGVYNYSTPDSSDIKSVVVSPDGTWIAAATSDRQVLVFSSSGASGSAITPTVTIPLPANAEAMAMSGNTSTGVPLLTVGVQVGANGTIFAYNVNSALPVWNFTGFNTNGSATIVGIAISNDGTDVAGVATVTPPSSTGHLPYFSYIYLHGRTMMQWYNETSGNTIGVDVSMTGDGSRIVVGTNYAFSEAKLLFFAGTGGTGPNDVPTATWVPPSSIGDPGTIAATEIAGNGVATYETSQDSFDATPGPGVAAVESNLNGANLLSVSEDGCHALVSVGGLAYYYNISTAATGGCNANSFTSSSLHAPLWTGTFSANVVSVAIAANNPDYFVVAWSNEVQWFYAYQGMPQGHGAAYRTLTTSGPVNEVAYSSSGGSLAVGSRWVAGANQEFTLAQDSGIPQYTPLVITATAVASSPGQTSASEVISWSAPPSLGFDYLQVTFSSGPGNGSIPNSITISTPTTLSQSVGGFAFSTTYTVNVVLVTFGGAEMTHSAATSFTTTSSPPVVDPFEAFEIAAIAVIAAGAVTFVVLRSKLPKHPTAASPAPAGPRAPPPSSPPPFGGSPGGGQ